MADHSALSVTEQYVALLARIEARLAALSLLMSGSETNVPVGSFRLSPTNKRFEKWTGTAWVEAIDVWDMTVSASKLLAQLKTVDGAGSGLNADLLDDKEASDFVLATEFTADNLLTLIKTVDGAGSGLSADMLDGKQASDFCLATQAAVIAALGYTPVNATTYSSDFAQLKNTNGYQKFKNGMIMQWGTIASLEGETATTVTLPISYANSHLVAFAIPKRTSSASGINGCYASPNGMTSLIVVNDSTGGTTTSPVMWLSIGY